jgi:hypothetical protein
MEKIKLLDEEYEVSKCKYPSCKNFYLMKAAYDLDMFLKARGTTSRKFFEKTLGYDLGGDFPEAKTLEDLKTFCKAVNDLAQTSAVETSSEFKPGDIIFGQYTEGIDHFQWVTRFVEIESDGRLIGDNVLTIQASQNFRKDVYRNPFKNGAHSHRLATEEEEEWFLACEKANKFIPLEDVKPKEITSLYQVWETDTYRNLNKFSDLKTSFIEACISLRDNTFSNYAGDNATPGDYPWIKREATQEEIDWMDACIKKNRFRPLKDLKSKKEVEEESKEEKLEILAKKGEYVVLLSTCTGKDDIWKDVLPVHHVYKLAENCTKYCFSVEKTINGNFDRWSTDSKTPDLDKLKIRKADGSEVHSYEICNKPCPVSPTPVTPKECYLTLLSEVEKFMGYSYEAKINSDFISGIVLKRPDGGVYLLHNNSNRNGDKPSKFPKGYTYSWGVNGSDLSAQLIKDFKITSNAPVLTDEKSEDEALCIESLEDLKKYVGHTFTAVLDIPNNFTEGVVYQCPKGDIYLLHNNPSADGSRPSKMPVGYAYGWVVSPNNIGLSISNLTIGGKTEITFKEEKKEIITSCGKFKIGDRLLCTGNGVNVSTHRAHKKTLYKGDNCTIKSFETFTYGSCKTIIALTEEGHVLWIQQHSKDFKITPPEKEVKNPEFISTLTELNKYIGHSFEADIDGHEVEGIIYRKGGSKTYLIHNNGAADGYFYEDKDYTESYPYSWSVEAEQLDEEGIHELVITSSTPIHTFDTLQPVVAKLGGKIVLGSLHEDLPYDGTKTSNLGFITSTLKEKTSKIINKLFANDMKEENWWEYLDPRGGDYLVCTRGGQTILKDYVYRTLHGDPSKGGFVTNNNGKKCGFSDGVTGTNYTNFRLANYDESCLYNANGAPCPITKAYPCTVQEAVYGTPKPISKPISKPKRSSIFSEKKKSWVI